MSDDATPKKIDSTKSEFCEALEFLEKTAREDAERNLDKGNLATATKDIERIKRAENLLFQAGCSGGEHVPTGTPVAPGQGSITPSQDTGRGGPG